MSSSSLRDGGLFIRGYVLRLRCIMDKTQVTQVSPASLSTPTDTVEYFKRTLIADYMPNRESFFYHIINPISLHMIASINLYIRANMGYIQTRIAAVWAKI